MKIKISTFESKDLPAIKKIYCQILKDEWRQSVDQLQLEKELEESFEEEYVLVASLNDTVIGFVSWHEPDSFVHHLYIEEKYRGQGFGKELINCALQRLRYPIRLKCLQKNKDALEFYFAKGWYLAGEGSSEEGDFFLLEFSKVENKQLVNQNFKLHERLIKDCYVLGKLPLSYLLLNKNAEAPWFILVPETLKVEIHDLDSESQKRLFQEALELSLFLKNILKVDKVNMGAIGNLVPQLHFHVVGRRVNDYCWPKVVWGAEGFREYENQELNDLVGIVKSSFGSRMIV